MSLDLRPSCYLNGYLFLQIGKFSFLSPSLPSGTSVMHILIFLLMPNSVMHLGFLSLFHSNFFIFL